MDILLTKSKNDTMDPLSVIIKLFIYSYKPSGTKISINNNRLIIQDAGLFQGTVRTLYGDTKNDINIIYFPVIFASKYYLDMDHKAKFYKVFDKLLLSFNKLKETYYGSEIVYNIDQLKTIVSSFMDNENYDPAKLFRSYNSPGSKIKQDIYNHINSVWTKRRLEVLFGYIDEILETSSSELCDILIESLSSYMNCIDMITYNLINNL
jgi:hypothetical protein